MVGLLQLQTINNIGAGQARNLVGIQMTSKNQITTCRAAWHFKLGLWTNKSDTDNSDAPL
ncbi:hypothetical protein D3C80_2085770 [compost metagenome]